MKTDAELDAIALKLYWHHEHGEQRAEFKLLRSIELDAWREARELVGDNSVLTVLPEMDRIIQQLQLK